MTNDSLFTKIKIFVLSILFTGVIILLYFLDKELEWNVLKIVSCVIVSVYAFFLAPTIKYIINWFKSLSAEEVYYAGFKIGYYGIALLILIDPVIGIMYFCNKKFKHNGGNKIIIIGWYIM